MRILVTLVLGLHLSSDQCHGFAEEGLRELCKKLPNTDPSKNCNCPARNGPSMGPSESTTFSCSDCSPNTMYEPYVCKNCYKGTEENEAFLCQRCKLGKTKSKPVICDACESNPTTPESDSGFHNIVILIFDPLNKSALMLSQSTNVLLRKVEHKGQGKVG